MIRFERRTDGTHVSLSAAERALLIDLTRQFGAMLGADIEMDSAAARLFPQAYPDDPDAQAEYRRYTFDDLRAQKTANARRMRAWLEGREDTPLRPADEQAWLRCLTDLRLTLAERIGITEEHPWGPDDEPDPDVLPALQVYDWLGAAQEHLVVTVAGW